MLPFLLRMITFKHHTLIRHITTRAIISDSIKEPIPLKKISGELTSISTDSFTSQRNALMEPLHLANCTSSSMDAVNNIAHGMMSSLRAQKAQVGEQTAILNKILDSELPLMPMTKLFLSHPEEMLAMIWELRILGLWATTTTQITSTRMASKLKLT